MATMNINFEEGFVDAIIADAEKAGKPLSENDQGFLRMIEEANRSGTTSFEFDDETAKKISEKIGQIMVDHVANFSASTHQEYDDFVLKMLDEHGQFVAGAQEARNEIQAGYHNFHQGVMNDYNSFRDNAKKNMDEFRRNLEARSSGMQGASASVHAGFSNEEKKDTHAAMSQQHTEYVAQMETKSMNSEPVYVTQMETKSMNSEPVYVTQEETKSMNQPAVQASDDKKMSPAMVRLMQAQQGR